jgi:4-hydroxymandelate oxidase
VTPDAADLQRRARELLPPEVYDYYAGGSGSERTLRANQKAWRRVWLAPRVLRDASAVSTATTLLGTPVATPVGVAPRMSASCRAMAAAVGGTGRAASLGADVTQRPVTHTVE